MFMLNEINCGMTTSIAQTHEVFTYQQTTTTSFSKPAPVPAIANESRLSKEPIKAEEPVKNGSLQ